MTQDEILQTLREVIEEADNFTTWTVSTPHLVELVKRAVEAERDECACLCDALERTKVYGAKECAEGIRARGQA